MYGQAPAASAPLTMQQTVDYALAHNPTLLSAQQNLLSMKGQEVEAGLRQNPSFTVYGTDLTNPATSTTPYAYSLQMSRLFERGQKRRWQLGQRPGDDLSNRSPVPRSATGNCLGREAGIYQYAPGQSGLESRAG